MFHDQFKLIFRNHMYFGIREEIGKVSTYIQQNSRIDIFYLKINFNNNFTVMIFNEKIMNLFKQSRRFCRAN